MADTPLEAKQCEWCGNDFIPSRANQKFCTPNHAQKASNARRKLAKEEPLEDEQGRPLPLARGAAIEALQRDGYVVTKLEPQEPIYKVPKDIVQGKERIKVGIVSDTHMCSTYQQLTHLRNFYEYAEKDVKVDFFLHAGDLSDGPHQAHRDAPYNLFKHGSDAQTEYIVEAYPESKVGTIMIGGNHDYMHINQNGFDIVNAVAQQRDDITYLGDQMEAYIDVGKIRIQMVHPYKAGAYALSYTLQKYIENLSSENKPHIVLMGNFHKVCYLPGYRNVESWMLPCFQAQTPFLRGKNISPVVGGLIMEFGIDDRGLAPAVKHEMVRFPEMVANDYAAAA